MAKEVVCEGQITVRCCFGEGGLAPLCDTTREDQEAIFVYGKLVESAFDMRDKRRCLARLEWFDQPIQVIS